MLIPNFLVLEFYRFALSPFPIHLFVEACGAKTWKSFSRIENQKIVENWISRNCRILRTGTQKEKKKIKKARCFKNWLCNLCWIAS